MLNSLFFLLSNNLQEAHVEEYCPVLLYNINEIAFSTNNYESV